MARKKNSAPVNNREEKARTEVRHALRDLPTTAADAIKKEREFFHALAQAVVERGEWVARRQQFDGHDVVGQTESAGDAAWRADRRLSEGTDFRLLDRFADVHNGALDRFSDVLKSDAFRDHDYIFRAMCANRIERALPPSPWRDYALQALRRPDPPSRDALLRHGMSERNLTIRIAVLTAVGLGLAPTRNPAARYTGGAHSACSLVAEELKKMGVRRCNEDAVQKIYKKFKKGLPDTWALLDGLPDNLLESFSKNFPSEK